MTSHTLLLKHADLLCTMADASAEQPAGIEIRDAGLYARDGVIEQVGPTASLPDDADQIIDMTGHVVIPGMVNTHHHLFQNLTRVVPPAQDAPLFGWLQTLYPVWSHLGPEHIYWSTVLGLAELALSGCTTSSDHLYLYPNGAKLDDSMAAAADIGVRFHGTRGSMSIGESKGGLPPDNLCEDEAAILADSQRVVEAFHNPARHAMQRVALAPCSPFSVSMDLMRETADMARALGVGLHTHLAENVEDIDYSLAQFGMRPGDYAEAVGWTGDDVWHAHCVQLDSAEIDLFARTGTSVAHCPCSNMRLASGIAPVREMIDQGVKVGIGVDGSASNDSGHMLNEARQAMLLQRVCKGGDALNARQTLALATRGGAAVLGRDDIGILAPGYAADITAFDRRTIDFAGSDWDPLASLLFCGPVKASHTVINGRHVVANGQLTTMEMGQILERHTAMAHHLMQKSGLVG
ncbi:MAG TPA: 8-oxoguanine deaminase [Alphaproteobacteria bacterium]|jgi:cytosine/adenosine deaminase-related metal-dependent hydrolase|nr:MAG: 8-oxoguanine deaminase [SAR116 cluster bacterium MED-G05]HBP58195.1 8-oxoguanine deaminase [Alphaproteobacteria bacterium]HBP72266.1 8-oxoguanine deaminase [Alphaproteobacteria bacterium]HCA15023.1 8-oxoguanine deaminase [Alphaproteobacteria bacterium]HCD21664.1 8-oxoguanine deaminase [Alphaproteobacteria bacterium]